MWLLILLFSWSSAFAAVPDTAIRTKDVTSICNTKTSGIRLVSKSTKKQVYKNAHISYGDRTLCSKGYEVDHRISLELGGTNDISNLQLQAYCREVELSVDFPSGVLYDAHAKDKEENSLHKQICNKEITPAQAQEQIYNWKN